MPTTTFELSLAAFAAAVLMIIAAKIAERQLRRFDITQLRNTRFRGCPKRSGKSVATPARLWYQSGVFNKEEKPPMKKPYKIVSGASTPNSRELADWLAKDGQLLIPLVELLEKGERAIDEVIDVMGRATIEAVLQMSAVQVAGPKEQGRRDADREVYWHGVQAGRVALKERQLQVDKPRLRKKRPRADEPGEVEIPAYTALQATSGWRTGCWSWCCRACRRASTRRCCRRWPTRWA